MPITLPSLTRRSFIRTTLATGAAATFARPVRAAGPSGDPSRFALLADTHISGNREFEARGVHLANNLKKTVGQITSLERQPRTAIVTGDCAYKDGQSKDYRVLADLLAPARKSGIAFHLALGNHDHRQRALDAIPLAVDGGSTMADRRVSVIDSPHANWFVLDSLDIVNKSPGKLGEEQLSWLDKALSGKADKPALVAVHHNPAAGQKKSCLTDTKAFFAVLARQRQVKAYIYGHTHNWNVTTGPNGLHLVNLPPVAYVFGKGKPSGWVDVQLADSGASFTLQCLDTKHAQHGKTVELAWRAG